MILNLIAGNGAHLARKGSCVWRPAVGSRLYERGSWQALIGVLDGGKFLHEGVRVNVGRPRTDPGERNYRITVKWPSR